MCPAFGSHLAYNQGGILHFGPNDTVASFTYPIAFKTYIVGGWAAYKGSTLRYFSSNIGINDIESGRFNISSALTGSSGGNAVVLLFGI